MSRCASRSAAAMLNCLAAGVGLRCRTRHTEEFPSPRKWSFLLKETVLCHEAYHGRDEGLVMIPYMVAAKVRHGTKTVECRCDETTQSNSRACTIKYRTKRSESGGLFDVGNGWATLLSAATRGCVE